MLSITINEQNTYQSKPGSKGIEINDQLMDWEILTQDEFRYEILVNNKVYNAEIISVDFATKAFEIKINGKVLAVKAKDEMDLLLEKLGIDHEPNTTISNIKAPMPGLILEVNVHSGQEIKKDEPILVLEAMKMENVIKSPVDGTIKSVKVAQGESVEKNQVLVEF